MELSPLVLQWREEALQEGKRQIVENLLKTRFGELDDQLSAIITQLLKLPPEEYTRLLLQLSQLSREELSNRFSTQLQP